MPLRPREPLDDSWLFQDPMTLELVDDDPLTVRRNADALTRLTGPRAPEIPGSSVSRTDWEPFED